MKKTEDSYAIIAKALAKYLKEKGWELIAVDGSRIEQPIGSLKYNFNLVFSITARKLKKKETK